MLLFIYFLVLFIIFCTINKSYCTILTNFLHLFTVLLTINFQFLQNKQYLKIPKSWKDLSLDLSVREKKIISTISFWSKAA